MTKTRYLIRYKSDSWYEPRMGNFVADDYDFYEDGIMKFSIKKGVDRITQHSPMLYAINYTKCNCSDSCTCTCKNKELKIKLNKLIDIIPIYNCVE